MMSAEFDTAHAKLERASEHSQEMAQVWNTYLEPHPFDTDLLRTGELQWTLRVTQQTPTPERLSVLFGEWLFNLRSALDSLIWATAVHESRQEPPPAEDKLLYPIFDSARAWESNLYRLNNLADHQRKMLLTMRPFNTTDPDANFLGWINRLARIERHRRLTVATARVAVVEPVLQVRQDARPQLQWGERVLRAGSCDLFRLTLQHGDGPPPVVNPRIGIDPEISDWAASPFWSRIRFTERIRMMETFVRAEISLYEYDCTGETRGWDAMTDSFRTEADQRRASKPDTPISRPQPLEVAWSRSETGRTSTWDRFTGKDFSPHGPGPVQA